MTAAQATAAGVLDYRPAFPLLDRPLPPLVGTHFDELEQDGVTLAVCRSVEERARPVLLDEIPL